MLSVWSVFKKPGLSGRISIGYRQFKNLACLVYSVWFLAGCVLCVKWQELTPIRARSCDCEEENVTKPPRDNYSDGATCYDHGTVSLNRL
jgi:hypothetical protein